MSVKRETTVARRRLEFMLRACVRLLARPAVTDEEIRTAIENLLARVGPGDDASDVLAELVRRGEYLLADGYSPQSMADSDIHGGFAGATPVEKRALRLAADSDEDAARARRPVEPDTWQEHERDVAADKLQNLVTSIDSAASQLAHADRDRKFLLSIQWRQHDPDEERVDKCSLCRAVVTNFGSDRLKSLYCPACYEAWRRVGSPRDVTERRRFEVERLAKLEERAVVHVTCEHVCCPADMRRSPTHEHFHAPETCPSCAEVRAEAS